MAKRKNAYLLTRAAKRFNEHAEMLRLTGPRFPSPSVIAYIETLDVAGRMLRAMAEAERKGEDW